MRIIMNPTTTPGKARGKVSRLINILLPQNSCLVRNRPQMDDMARVAMVTISDRKMVFARVEK
jgi:hypothetical protein